MEKYVNLILDSMVQHKPEQLPMASRYIATENCKPAAVRHMTCWRSIQGVKCIGHLIQDKVENQVIVVATVDEGVSDSLLTARIKIVDEKIAELEIYLIRSRAESGFWFEPAALAHLPEGWSLPIPEHGRASREELLQLGRDMFDSNNDRRYFGSEVNYGMENGGVVCEHIDYISRMVVDGAPPIDLSFVPESGRMSMPLPELFRDRPYDSASRVLAVDEEQGIVVSIGMVDGYVSPYVVSDEVSSCFVPEVMIEAHRKTLLPEVIEGKSLIEEKMATGVSLNIARFYSGKLQGIHQIIVLSGYGTRSIW